MNRNSSVLPEVISCALVLAGASTLRFSLRVRNAYNSPLHALNTPHERFCAHPPSLREGNWEGVLILVLKQ